MKKSLICLLILLSAVIFRVDYAGASAQDFTIKNFKADYYLDRDSDGYSTLKTVESIIAEFPAIDQNHGIERVIPQKYDKHKTNLQIQSIKDENGSDVSYSTYEKNNNLALRIGDADTYVHGTKNYVITYTQRNVTRFFNDTNRDEFYWNINGIGWSQKFNNVEATLHLGNGLNDSLTGDMYCYYGVQGSTKKCAIVKNDDNITTTGVSLNVNENVTIAVGFKGGTFKVYQQTLIEWLEQYIIYIELSVAIILVVASASLKIFKDKSAAGRGIIVPEYLPPKGVDVALSALIKSAASKWFAATLVDLAVKHKLQIVDGGKKGLFGKDTYKLKLIDINDLSEVERSVVEILFGVTLVVGGEYELKPGSDYALTSKLSKIYNSVTKQADSDGYYIKNKQIHLILGIIAGAALAQTALVFWFYIDSTQAFILLIIGMIASLICIAIPAASKPLSGKGRELKDYLDGLEMYIRTAEADRIKILQSPQGADRTPVDVNNSEMILKLYERVLPYAVLFGIEDDWVKVLGSYYERQNSTPDWYLGSSAFNIATFSSAVSSFSASAAASSNYSSSSTGGSGGGGFSGGGGGGGGGGGW